MMLFMRRILHLHKKTFFTPFIKTYPGYIKISTNISGLRPAPSVAPGGRGTASSDTRINRKPKITNIEAPGRAVIFPKHTSTTFLE